MNLVSVLEVADQDDLWAAHVRALRRAGVFRNDQDAADAMRTFWTDGVRMPPADASAMDLSREDRRLLVAWTWPNPWGAAASTQDVFDRVRARAQRVGPDPGLVWAEEVRLRVSEVVRRLNTWEVRKGSGVLWAASGLLKDAAAAQERLLAMKHAAEPLVVEWLLNLSHRATLVFDEQFTELGTWAYDGVGLRAALAAQDDIMSVAGALSKVFTSREDLSLVQASAERILVDLTALHVYDPRVFHKQLPKPTARDRKFYNLFEHLDEQAGARTLTYGEVDELLPRKRPVGSRGPFRPGLPDGARKPQWWANPRPGEHGALARFTQSRAWLAAGFTAHPQTRGVERRVVGVRFDPLPDRDLWWRHRQALRSGTFTPWEQIAPSSA